MSRRRTEHGYDRASSRLYSYDELYRMIGSRRAERCRGRDQQPQLRAGLGPDFVQARFAVA